MRKRTTKRFVTNAGRASRRWLPIGEDRPAGGLTTIAASTHSAEDILLSLESVRHCTNAALSGSPAKK